MPGDPRLFRRGSTYNHRAAVPQDIVDTYGKREETFSLRTKDRAEAFVEVRICIGGECRQSGLQMQHRDIVSSDR